MTDSRDDLDALMRAAGSPLDTEALDALVAGVAAAAPEGDPRAWHALVVDPAEGAVPEALSEALEARLAGARSAGTGRVVVDRSATAGRVAALRRELASRDLTGYVVPRADPHQGESVPPHYQRLAWLTGFTGSAGVAVVLADRAALFVDGRYTLQARDEVDGAVFTFHHLVDEPVSDWLVEILSAGDRLGYDPWIATRAGVERLTKACARAGAELVAVESDPLDAIWPNRPPLPLGPVVPHPAAYAGEEPASKRERVAAKLRKEGAAAAVLAAPDSIAWLLNIRGQDVPHTPTAHAFAIVDPETVRLFVDTRKLTAAARRALGNAVAVEAPDRLVPALSARAGDGPILVDPQTVPVIVAQTIEGAGGKIVAAADPVIGLKAVKNETELAGMRDAHRRDGAALTRFLAWLDEAAPAGGVSETAAAERLRTLRAEDPLFRGVSFDTISGSGPNGAIVHYRVSPATDRVMRPGELYLVDSGAQYLDGTTDVTRTVAVGPPGEEERERFTRVLKGHIAVSTARFPRKTSGAQLDTLARRPLWEAGLDFDHGTGHGVGCYLGVHEGPAGISKRSWQTPLEPGMVLSNEPGYYRDGAYGIRIENLLIVAEMAGPGDERPMLGFEVLTLAPIDRRLIAVERLDAAERAWVDAYHARIAAEIGPLLDPETRAWLERAAAPL